ncbi:MAG: SBBP repeat-containing protein [Ignavibacteria bacterium]|nr:SBBP repeat-containing protein [Ignavibacteria bacterium]
MQDLAIDNSGNVYVTGTTDLSSNELASATIKYNSAGAQQWAQIFQLPGYERNHSHEIISDDLGNTYVFGYSVSFGGNYSSVITKYNTLGIEQWRKIDNGEANEGLLFDNSGNIVHYVNLSYGSSYGIRKINSDGGVVWSNSMHLQGYNDGLNAKSICNDANDNFYIASP